MARIVVGMSGGVDSAVAAYLLQEEGHDICGVFMKNWDEEKDGQCTAEQDYEDARSVCLKLGIPFYTVTFAKEYWDIVFSYFLREYSLARTPNPDVLCNSEIKFKAFLDYAQSALSADFIATGHYARIARQPGMNAALLKGLDEKKDQSYFLCRLSQDQISSAYFPLGGWLKPQVREKAKFLGLRVAEKKDSTGVCFIGERNFRHFLNEYLPAQPGPIVDWDSGKQIGEHFGLMYYTIGQRRGLGIGGLNGDGRWYAAGKDISSNTLYCAKGDDNPKLFYTGFMSIDYSFINPISEGDYLVTVKHRYQSKEAKATLTVSSNELKVSFDEKQSSIAPGQIGAFYMGEECIGGAVIEKGFALA